MKERRSMERFLKVNKIEYERHVSALYG